MVLSCCLKSEVGYFVFWRERSAERLGAVEAQIVSSSCIKEDPAHTRHCFTPGDVFNLEVISQQLVSVEDQASGKSNYFF